jgi:2-polyprenyl-3-methyl-5-hydroxy-6-metoxy-1,4-benzoquinol methylase
MNSEVQAANPQRAASVKRVFEQADWYLQRWRCAIRLRGETVREFIGERSFESVLDIGCGDGSISTQLLKPDMKLTLNDLSSTMLALASSRVPDHLADHVDCINEDFSRVTLKFQPFDLIICLGVLAHVESPRATIDKIHSLLMPGGTVIVECTDARHPLTRLGAVYASVGAAFAASSYSLNLVSPADVVQMFESRGFTQTAAFRHVLPMFGMSRVLSQTTIYRMVRALCGSASKNRNAWLGNHYIFQFQKRRGQ